MNFCSVRSVVSLSLVVFGFAFTGLSEANAQYLLGVRLQDYRNQGALVIGTTSGSAAEKMVCPDCNHYHRITPGVNVITRVNGQPVRDTTEAVRAISASSANAQITILNLQRGTERTYQATLQPARSGPFSRLRRHAMSSQRKRNQPTDQSSDELFDAEEWLESIGSDNATDDSGFSDSPGIDNLELQYWNDRRMRNQGWSTSPDFAPVRW